jgi:hypothetical protein
MRFRCVFAAAMRLAPQKIHTPRAIADAPRAIATPRQG